MSIESRVSGVHPLKEPGYPTLATCLMVAAVRGALKDGPLAPPELGARLGVGSKGLGLAVPWMMRWGWLAWDGETLELLDTQMT